MPRFYIQTSTKRRGGKMQTHQSNRKPTEKQKECLRELVDFTCENCHKHEREEIGQCHKRLTHDDESTCEEGIHEPALFPANLLLNELAQGIRHDCICAHAIAVHGTVSLLNDAISKGAIVSPRHRSSQE